ncbi:MAG: 30S ribosomal protein S20 [Planctomycetes bacterium]|nr:30S ribosomal protein S20 [Planctomycetota bacterium]
MAVDFDRQTVIMLHLLFSAGLSLASKQDYIVPNSFSAKKRVRQNVKRRALSRWRKTKIKDQIKAFLNALQAQDVKTAETEYRKVCGILDKVACTSTMHRKTAARRKSRLAAHLKALKVTAA